MRKRTGSTDRPVYRPGPKVRVDREAVRSILLAKPDLYLREVRAELKASTGVDVSVPHLWKILTILGAMSLPGLIATMTVEAATDAEISLAYLEHILCPALRPGDMVVMDNLSSHKVAGVRE